MNYSQLSYLILPAMLAIAAPGASLEELFDETKVHEIRLTMHPSDWNRLRVNFTSDTYYPAIFEWRGIVVDEIAIRSRGLGSRSGDKPGLKVDFNRYAPSQEFLGLKSLVLDNLTQDPSMIRERISMQIYRRMGLAAPRVSHARLVVNGAYAGLYTMVEPVDKGFLNRNFGEDGGYLYDYEWGFEYWFENLGSDPSAYSPVPFQLQTNERTPNPRPLIEMIRTINEAPDAGFVDAVSAYIDPKHVLSYLAVESFLAEGDGLVGDWGANNFYLYNRKNSNQFLFIPWDKDFAFQHYDRSIWLNTDRNVLIRRLLAVPELRAHYLAEIARCAGIAGGLGGWLEQEVDSVAGLIRNDVVSDTYKPTTYAEFEEGVGHLRYFGFARANAIASEVQ